MSAIDFIGGILFVVLPICLIIQFLVKRHKRRSNDDEDIDTYIPPISKSGNPISNQPLSKYQITPEGKVYRVESDGSVTDLGYVDQKNNPPITGTKLTKWLIPIIAFMVVFTAVIGLYSYNDSKYAESIPKTSLFETDDALRQFISHYYNSIKNGTALDLFEDSGITYFRLTNVDRSVMKKELSKCNRNVDFVFDWSTMKAIPIETGDLMVVYSFDYYLHGRKTTKYRITTEMIISSNRRIKSVKDIQSVKINN